MRERALKRVLVTTNSSVRKPIFIRIIIASIKVLLRVVVTAHLFIVFREVIVNNVLFLLFFLVQRTLLILISPSAFLTLNLIFIVVLVHSTALRQLLVILLFLVLETALHTRARLEGSVAIQDILGLVVRLNGLPELLWEELQD